MKPEKKDLNALMLPLRVSKIGVRCGCWIVELSAMNRAFPLGAGKFKEDARHGQNNVTLNIY